MHDTDFALDHFEEPEESRPAPCANRLPCRLLLASFCDHRHSKLQVESQAPMRLVGSLGPQELLCFLYE